MKFKGEIIQLNRLETVQCNTKVGDKNIQVWTGVLA